jgi:flagellar hook-associated protein 2
LAANHQLGFATPAALTDTVAGSTVRLTSHDGTVHDLPTGGGTLAEVVKGINAATAQTGVTATAVRVDDGSYRLLVQSSATGADTDFTLTDGDGTTLLGGAAVRAGADAQVSLGLGITATSSSNTFTDLVPGLSLTLSSTATLGRTTTVTVAQDPSTAQASVKAFVDQLNSLLGTIDTKTANGTGTTAKGVLSGDAAARGVRDQLLTTVFGTGTTSMAGVGIQTDRYGKLVLDEAAFAKAYAADPAAVAAQFTRGTAPAAPGWAARVQDVAKAASDPVSGSVTSAVSGRTSTIDRLGDDIDAWDLRLELRRTSLTAQYTALETALSTLQGQGNWLASQISSLNSSSS